MNKISLGTVLMLLCVFQGYVRAATVGPGNITTTVTQSTGGTTTILGDTNIDTTGTGGNGVNVTNGTVELGAGPLIQISSNAVGISINASSFPAFLTSLNGSQLSIVTTGASNSYGISVSGISPTSGVPLLSLANSSIHTSGATSHGVFLNPDSSVSLDNVAIEASGATGRGIYLGASSTLVGDGISILTHGANASGIIGFISSVANVSNLTINTHGNSAFGIEIQIGAIFNLTSGFITTLAPFSTGIAITQNAVLNADTFTILTEGNNARGVVFSQSGGTLNNGQIIAHGSNTTAVTISVGSLIGSNLSLLTTNANSSGVYLTSAAHVTLSETAINTVGNKAYGFNLQGGTLEASNVRVATQGINAAGLYITSNTAGTLNTASFINTELNSAQGPGIAVSGGIDTISLTNSLILSPTYWLHVGQSAAAISSVLESDTADSAPSREEEAFIIAPSNATLTINHSTLNGAALTDTGNVSTVSLNNNSLWNMTDSSNLSSLTNVNSQIVFTPPVNDQYKTLTLENYIGQAGIVSLNTFLDADDSPSDTVVIDGGSATGSTGLVINNTLGAGAITTGNGILVVEAINDGTTTEEAFSLVNTVAAGPYEYLLYQGGIDGSLLNNWYLRSTLNDEDVPNYRPEISLYAAVPSNLLLYSRSVLGSFHERVGAEEQVQQRKNAPLYRSFFNGSWVRVLNRQGKISNQGALKDGPAFDYRLYALQAGVDVFHHQYDTGHRDFIGFFGIGGDNRSRVEHYTQEKAGDANFKAYGAGAYWTHITPNGAYLDGVIQANWFDLNVHSASQVLRSPTAQVFAYSLEGGIPIVLWKQWSIEPEAQVVYQTLPGFNNLDAASQVYMDTTESLIGRLSGRLVWNKDPIAASYSKKKGNMSVWITPSIAYEGRGNSSTQFSSSNGWVPFPSTLKGGWFSVDLGTTVQVNDYVSLYGTLLGETYLNGRGKAYNAMLGCRVNLL